MDGIKDSIDQSVADELLAGNNAAATTVIQAKVVAESNEQGESNVNESKGRRREVKLT